MKSRASSLKLKQDLRVLHIILACPSPPVGWMCDQVLETKKCIGQMLYTNPKKANS
jgi:hypothetical protein